MSPLQCGNRPHTPAINHILIGYTKQLSQPGGSPIFVVIYLKYMIKIYYNRMQLLTSWVHPQVAQLGNIYYVKSTAGRTVTVGSARRLL